MVKLRERPTPFFGEAIDRELLGPEFRPGMALVGSTGDGSLGPVVFDEMAGIPDELLEAVELEAQALIPGAVKPMQHPDYREKGTEAALGFMPHRGENRKKRLAGVATWAPPKVPEGEQPPTRRELWAQRQKQRRGKLDPELRRLQRRKLESK